jgi:poly-gamma-glutamate capsule biosynthesis protein CapA/YwtB (metallophosphatase superfamily)
MTRRLAAPFQHADLAAIVRAAEARFTNFEVLTPGDDGFPSAVSGGTWARAPAGVIGDLRDFGFNLMAWANNHTLDYSYGGLAATTRALDEHGMVHAGVGRNLAEASKPRYLECPSGRVALIAITSTFHESAAAGQQRPDSPGRPGVNPLRYTTRYTLPSERLATLAAIADECGINDEHKARLKDGFAEPAEAGVVLFGKHRFRQSDTAGSTTEPKSADVTRVCTAIGEARRQADFVLVSLHAHEMAGQDKTVPADFLRLFAQSCISAGAHAVIGHGPHVLRGIEIFQNRPIFYSLGNFIFQNETVENLPADFYEKFELGLTENVADALDKRSATNTKGFAVNPWAWKSIVARFGIEGEALTHLELFPVELGFGQPRPRRGLPRLSDDPAILRHLAELSARYGARIVSEDNVGRVLL